MISTPSWLIGAVIWASHWATGNQSTSPLTKIDFISLMILESTKKTFVQPSITYELRVHGQRNPALPQQSPPNLRRLAGNYVGHVQDCSSQCNIHISDQASREQVKGRKWQNF